MYERISINCCHCYFNEYKKTNIKRSLFKFRNVNGLDVYKRQVIAVPTSIGYGANFEGLSALLAMLNSCASGVSVVNIDNGFGAGFMAHTINCLGGKK